MQRSTISLGLPVSGRLARQVTLLLLLTAALAGFFLLLEFVVSLVSTGPRDILAVSPAEERRFGVPNGVDLLEFLVLASSIVLGLAVLIASVGWPLRGTSLRASWRLAIGVLATTALVASGAYLSFSGVLGNAISYDEHLVQRRYLESGSLILLAAFFLSLTIAGILHWRLLVATLLVWLVAGSGFGLLDTEPIDGLLLFPRTHLLEVPANFAAAVGGYLQADGASSEQRAEAASTATSSAADTSLDSEVTALQLPQPKDAPVFQVTDAVHTRYLRTATGDSYSDGAWSQLDRDRVLLEDGVPVPEAVEHLAEGLHLPTVPPLHEFADQIVVSPIEGADSLPAGVLPITRNLQSIDTSATYFPFSETLSVDSSVSSYRLESTIPVFALRDKVGAPAAEDQTLLQLPDGLPPRVHELAAQFSETDSPYLKARMLQAYLQEEYEFGAAESEEDVRQLPAGQDPVDWFLFDHRVGTGGNFSSAFVVLARAADVPARVVSGWVVARRPGTQTVHRGQTHQWAEIALDGLGWVTIDPIPRDAFADTDANHALEVAFEDVATSGAPEVRDAVAGLWGNGDDPEALLLLFQAIDSTQERDAADAARMTLSALALEQFIEMLLDHEDPLMRAAAAYGLEVLADPDGVDALMQALATDEDARVRVAAADALAVLGKDRAEGSLLQALSADPDATVRAAVAQALGSLKTEGTAEQMAPFLSSDPASEVRVEVALTLGELRDDVALLPLLDARSGDESAEVRDAAAAALAEWDFAALLEVLENAEDPAHRAAAAQLLGERGYREAIAPLGRALSDPDEEVRSAARSALEEIGDVAWLESGGGVLTYGGDIAFIPSVTAESASRVPHTPVFQVTGASDTGLLRLAVGDVYVYGSWLPHQQEGLLGGIGGIAFRPGDVRALQPDGTGAFNNIYLSGLEPGQLILSGHMPTSLHAESFSRPVTFWVQGHTVTAEGPSTRYDWDATVYDYSPGQLNAAQPQTGPDGFTYMEVPESEWVGRVRALATEITAGRVTPYAKAKAIEQYLQEEYAYRFAPNATGTTPAGQDPIATFLFDSRAGTCGNFSSAFVMLARSVGIPARVVSGWAIAETAESQTVYLDQAHQWAEVPFEGLGWVSFDPTPDGAPSRAPDPAPSATDAGGQGTGGQDTGTDGGAEASPLVDAASLAREDASTRDSRLDTLEREGANVTRLENGGALVELGDALYMAVGMTPNQATQPPAIPIFRVRGAAHTGYLRTSAGDVYEDGGWRQLDPVDVPYTAGSDVPEDVWEQYTAPAGGFSGVSSDRRAYESLFGFRDNAARIVSDWIQLLPAERFDRLPYGIMPTSLDLQETDLDGVFHPFSATFSSELQVTSHSWTSNVSLFSPGQYLAAAAADADATYTQLPPDLPARIRELAQDVTGPHDSPYAKARALEQHLMTRYTYRFASSPSAGVPPAGRDPVDWFLFDRLEGTCGVFSSAFVVLARSVGIPARVVSGWAISPTAGAQTVRLDQAHQWAEIALEGIGWVRFDPTPSGPSSRASGEDADGSDSASGPVDTITNITRWPSEIRRMTPFVVGGTLLTAGGQNVNGMTVEIYINETKEHGGTRIGTTTSRSGRFEAEVQLPADMELGAYQLLARAVGNERFNESWSDPDIKVFSGNRIELSGPAEVALNARAVFNGKLIEDSGWGVAGRQLTVTFDEDVVSSVTTDPTGQFTFFESFSRLGQHWVEVEIRGGEFLLDNIARLDFEVVLPTEVEVYPPSSVVVGEEFRVAGELRGADGRALAGKSVGVRVGSAREQSVQTDREGRFEVAGTASTAGEFTVSANFRGEGSVLASGGTARFEALHVVALTLEGPFRLERGDGATFEGKVASDTFSPTGQVELTMERPSGELVVVPSIGEDGTFEYLHPSFDSTGQHMLTAHFAGGEFVEPASEQFAFEVLEPTVLTLDGPAIVRDGEQFRLTGTLRERSGNPVPNATVQVSGGEQVSLVTDAEGRFSWDAQAAFDENVAHDPHESTLRVESVFEDTDQLAASSAMLEVAVGLPRILVEPLEPVERGSEATLRGTVLLGTYPVPSAELTVGPDGGFRANDVGAFTHPYPVSSDEPLGTAELVIAAPALDVSVTVSLAVKSAANLIVTPVSRVRPGRTTLLQVALLDDTGVGIPQAALRSSQGVDAVTDDLGIAMLELTVPEQEELQGSLVEFTYAGNDLNTPLSVPYFWEGAITPAGFNWLLWVGTPGLLALAVAAAYAGRRLSVVPLLLLMRRRGATTGPVPAPYTASGGEETEDDAGTAPRPVQLQIAFQRAAADLADVWGVGEEVSITVSVADEEGLAIAGAIVDVSVADHSISQLAVVGNDGAYPFSWSSAEPGEYPVSVGFAGDYDHLPSAESRVLRIVDFREEIVRLYGTFLDWAKERDPGVTEQSTPREVEVILVNRGLPIPQKALDELISRFEEADYSEHPITRRHYEAMYRAWSAVVEARA
ncbi:MAG: HEAT repeat domain-containing protein [Chloroflexi bacterium]|nr:HEAT repeat domain-containing protein [Chloroflexota bacterium]